MSKPLLGRVIERYLGSGDFNGYFLTVEQGPDCKEAVELVRNGLLQVVSEEDYPNPHIRPWPSRRSTDQQIASIEQMTPEMYGVCLYPTPKALAKTRKQYPDQPYTRAMAKGRGALELAYFRFDVLEAYRNDPRFSFRFYDFGAEAVISDEAYSDETEPEHDKIIMDHVGFAYDLRSYDRENPLSPIVRRVCAFYTDLANLSPIHQLRWKTYQLDDESSLRPHPVWWAMQMGHWPDGIGPFDRVFLELDALNELHRRAFGTELFRTTARPSDFGWVLRPSQHEFDSFVRELDKLLSDNLRHQALDQVGIPSSDDKDQRIGSLNRLDRFLESVRIPKDDRSEVLAPFREVRAARQRPSHAIRENLNDATFVHKQVELLERVGNSLEVLRRFWQRHPANSDWEVAPSLADDVQRYRM